MIPKLSSRQWIALIAGAFLAMILLSQAFPLNAEWTTSMKQLPALSQHLTVNSANDVSQVVIGPPTKHFRDNLRNDTRYLTSWLDAGFTNDVMTIGNLIFLAMITNRVPILPPLESYIGGRPEAIPFSSIFDLPHLRRELNIPILEWHEVKDRSSTETDTLGCWNIWEVDDFNASGPRQSRNTISLGLDISYTRAPASVKLMPGHDMHSSYWALAPLAFSDARAQALVSPEVLTRPAERTGKSTPPDEQLLCFDYLFFVCADKPYEYDKEVYPAWHAVQRHFRWTSEVEIIGNRHLRRVLNVPDNVDIPPHITIHARHGDFKDWCPGPEPNPKTCFAPLTVFAARVAEVQKELFEKKGIHVEHVIVTSDEKDEEWWDEIKERGWLRIDHAQEKTAEMHGNWYPVIVDAYIQSSGLGFVGTDRSTFSTMARWRVRDWHDGVVRNVRWGTPDADAH